jgi:hypothetical protein
VLLPGGGGGGGGLFGSYVKSEGAVGGFGGDGMGGVGGVEEKAVGWLGSDEEKGTSTEDGASRDLAEAMEEVVTEKNQQPESLLLFFVDELPGLKTCLGVITGGRGISRCCLMPVLPGTKRCGVASH